MTTKKIALLGYGSEGEASYKYWSQLGATVDIYDENPIKQESPKGALVKIGSEHLPDLQQYDMVIRTPGLSPHKIPKGVTVWSATNEFFKQCPALIIGVTGTKGKGTTSSLIAAILEQAGKTVHLLGNIGRPALSVLPGIASTDIVVFELSSFQLWDIERSPQTAVVLMIEADHLNVHRDMQDYIDAKKQIGLHQTEDDFIVYHPTNRYSLEIANASKAKKVKYLSEEGAYLKEDKIVIAEQLVCTKSDIKLIGAHNVENVCAAVTAAWNYTQDIAAIKNAVTSFTGLPHRIEFVRTFQGVEYYNDSYSSTPAAAVAAIRSFTKPITLLLGGHDKKGDFSALAEEVSTQPNVVNIVIYGEMRQKIAEAFKVVDSVNIQTLGNTDFKSIIATAKECTKPGGVVILSPGTSSFDMFKNFAQRGDMFKKIVREF